MAADLTPLSQKAARLKIGMTRGEAIHLLGAPTWAIIPGDSGKFKLPEPTVNSSMFFELRWANAGCVPVVVSFDQNMVVKGWDEGRWLCGKGAKVFEPGRDYSCKKTDRNKFCSE